MKPAGSSFGYERGTAMLLIGLVWAVATLPGLSLRSFIWEEGTNAEIARSILAHGDFLQPVVYGLRWSEKPSLLAWLIAGVAALTGQVDEWSARLPAMVSVLATALMVQSMVMRVASIGASIFAALAFMLCPMLLQKLTIAEPDTLVTMFSFAAFAVWWSGAEHARVTFDRWLLCGAILAVMVLAKGPQPAAFFVLGTAGYLILNRRWADVPGLFVCLAMPVGVLAAWAFAIFRPGDLDLWRSYMRLEWVRDWQNYATHNPYVALQIFLGLLPASMVLGMVPWPWRRDGAAVPSIVAALVFYSGPATAALLLWPGANARYAMPIAPAVAVLAGIAWDRMEERGHIVFRQAAAAMVAVFAMYQIVLVTVAMPILADRFGASRTAGVAIAAAIAADPAPAYCTDLDTNQLFYMNRPIKCIKPADIKDLALPAWLVTPRSLVDGFAATRTDSRIGARVETRSGPELVAVRLEAK